MERPNAAGESSLQIQVIAASVVMLVLSSATVILRFYTRRALLGFLGPDDYLILAALIFSIGVTVGQIRQTHSALGRHAWLVSEDEMSKYRLEDWYTFLLYASSLSCTKISILLLYRRFLCMGWARISTNVVLALVVACSVWVLGTSFIDCIPLAAVWDKAVEGKCISMKVKIGNSYAHIITDFVIFLLPIPFVVGLTLGRRQKVGLMLVFCVGFFACLISVIRVVSLDKLGFTDLTYNLGTVAIWGAVEVNLAIICACLTTLKPLIVRLFPRLLKSSYMDTRRSLDYIDRQKGTAASASGVLDSRAKRESRGDVMLDRLQTPGNDSDDGEVDDLEGQVRRGVFMATPPKTHARLP